MYGPQRRLEERPAPAAQGLDVCHSPHSLFQLADDKTHHSMLDDLR
jgi:hypothetical protein